MLGGENKEASAGEDAREPAGRGFTFRDFRRLLPQSGRQLITLRTSRTLREVSYAIRNFYLRTKRNYAPVGRSVTAFHFLRTSRGNSSAPRRRAPGRSASNSELDKLAVRSSRVFLSGFDNSSCAAKRQVERLNGISGFPPDLPVPVCPESARRQRRSFPGWD